MPGRRDRLPRGARRGAAALLGSIWLITLAAAPATAGAATESVAKAKKLSAPTKSVPLASSSKASKKSKVTTRSTQVGFSSGTSAGASATCPSKSHITGGGFAVAPSYSNPGGLRAIVVDSHLADRKIWTATGNAWNTPSASGTFTTFARCEGNALGKLTVQVSTTVTVAGGSGGDLVVSCPPGNHVVSGGYTGDGPSTLVSPDALTFRIMVLGSRRTGTGQWTVTAFNRTAQPPANLTAYAVCEKDGKRQTVSEVSATAAINPNVRTSADASCTGKKHVVAGGFLLTPSTFPAATTLIASVDEFTPVGKKGWHVGLWEHPFFANPPGPALQTIAYCKKDPPKAKKK